MIITKDHPFTESEVNETLKELRSYIKTVIDLEKRICSAGARLHADSEKILIEKGSRQENLWGGGID